ncbi:MAG: hypothetical protein ACOCQ3_03855 [Natronomonas sp.]
MRAFGDSVEVLETPNWQVYPGLIYDWQARLNVVVAKMGAFWTDQLTTPTCPMATRSPARIFSPTPLASPIS